MADEPINPQAGTTQPQAGTQGSGTGAAPASNGQAPESELSPEELRAQLKAANAEAAKTRIEKKALEKRLEAIDNEKLTEAERVKKETEDAKAALAQAKTEARNARIEAAAVKLGFHDPLDGLQIGDAEDVDAALTALASKKPYLLKPSETITTTSPGNPARSTAKQPAAFDPKSPPSLTDSSLWKGK